ncbi:MAG: T9SS type A sorting domain-containing protein [Bacteroidetes bacterium]|nr:MAG: T9SS type A sorting domain-containing protein [Bacteroidota bacterium]
MFRKLFLSGFSTFLGLAVGHAQFLGGNSSGHSNAGISPAPCSAIAVNPFAGGNEDGHSSAGIVPAPCSAIAANPFAGGNSDGHSNGDVSPAPCSAIGGNPYAGGNSDGHSNAAITPIPCPAMSVNPFAGGNSDGHSNSGISPTPCDAIAVNPFSGGNTDGSSAFYLINDATCAPLPVELLFFNALSNGKNVDVIWSTASEWNTEHYLAERSKDGTKYEVVTKVQAAGTSSTVKDYAVVDIEPYQGISYYKLKQVDMNGAFVYYGPVAVKFSSEGINIYPNVSSGVFYISCNEANTNIDIYSTEGDIIFQSSGKQFSNMRIDLTAQSSGMYYVIVHSERESFTQKIVLSR